MGKMEIEIKMQGGRPNHENQNKNVLKYLLLHNIIMNIRLYSI